MIAISVDGGNEFAKKDLFPYSTAGNRGLQEGSEGNGERESAQPATPQQQRQYAKARRAWKQSQKESQGNRPKRTEQYIYSYSDEQIKRAAKRYDLESITLVNGMPLGFYTNAHGPAIFFDKDLNVSFATTAPASRLLKLINRLGVERPPSAAEASAAAQRLNIEIKFFAVEAA